MRTSLLLLCMVSACQQPCPPMECNEHVDILVPTSTFLTAPDTDTTFAVRISNGASTTTCNVELSAGTLTPGTCNDQESDVSLVDDQVLFRYARDPEKVLVRILDGSTLLDEGTFEVQYSGDRCCQSGEVKM